MMFPLKISSKTSSVKKFLQENRTAVHLAVDKGFMDIALVLIEKKPNLELKNKVVVIEAWCVGGKMANVLT